MLSRHMPVAEIQGWLMAPETGQLVAAADETRRRWLGDEVHLRGLIEIGNHCRRRCAYCGLSQTREGLTRYRLGAGEILAAAHQARALGYGTVVLQGGEDPGLTRAFVARVVHGIRDETGLAVTLSLGRRAEADWAAWREAGAERYLLRFETSNPALYRALHPGERGGLAARLGALTRLRELGYEIGTGMLVGLPGQSWEDLAADLDLLRTLAPDMIGLGPWVPHPATPLGAQEPSDWDRRLPAGSSGTAGILPASTGPRPAPDADTTLRALALARVLCPQSHLPATTALATVDGASGWARGLAAGANVLMPDLTPARYRPLYEIYPHKAGSAETPLAVDQRARAVIAAAGRVPGQGPGGSRRTAAGGGQP